MQTQERQVSRPAQRAEPPGQGPAWWKMISRRSKVLGILALLCALAVTGMSLIDPDATRRGPLLAMISMSTATGAVALLSLVGDARTAIRGSWWGGYSAGCGDAHEPEPTTGGKLLDLTSRLGRRQRTGSVTSDTDVNHAPPSSRRQAGALAVAGILVAGLTAAALWDSRGPRDNKPGAGAAPAPAVSISASQVPGVAAGTPSARPPGSPATHAAAPASGPPVGPSAKPTSPAALASTDPLGDGTYRVGVDIAAGAWTTGGVVNINVRPCQYSINGGAPVKIVLGVGATTVRLRGGDVFTTSGCKSWHWAA